jgi:hypothetical protein
LPFFFRYFWIVGQHIDRENSKLTSGRDREKIEIARVHHVWEGKIVIREIAE